ncbi:MAG: RHS repeat-associated core domain-containing protein [Candidatus Omnitrophota bacterium]|nr:RHS repeat-associated core domain-containing protein [Candidatus Omnitrophota bacterium]
MPKKSFYNPFHRVCASALIILHLVTFGPIREALAFSASSTSFKLNSGTLNSGGKDRNGTSAKLWQDVIAEPCIGSAQSSNFILNSGLLPTIQSNQPILTQSIPYQAWPVNTAKESAFDLDDYFSSPDGLALTFSVKGNSNISVSIDSATHVVSFSQPQDWFGAEKVYFTVTDSEDNTLDSNQVALQVISTASGAPNKPVITETQITPTIIKEGDLVKLVIKATDPDKQDLNFSYSGGYFNETAKYKQGDFWVSEATWQTPAQSKNHYNIIVTVSDGALTDTSLARINVGNFNHPPVMDPIPEIIANEGETVTIKPHVTDSDNDPIIFYYSTPFNSQGQWLTNYQSVGTYNIQVTASDGIDTVSGAAKLTINNTNQAPQVSLTSQDNRYTFKPKEEFTLIISALDPDSDPLTFSLTDNEKEIAQGSITGTHSLVLTYAEQGKHTLRATVTDSGGKSATDSKSIDIADPNANRDAINPVMGDFNADALTDLGLHNSETGEWEVCLSDHGVFRSALIWLTDPNKGKEWWPIGGDFNGDAKTDVGIYNNTTGELKIILSNGGDAKTSQGSFSAGSTWFNFSGASYSWQPFTGNFNGDKYTDFGLYNVDTGEVKAALGIPPQGAGQAGSGFGPLTTWASSAGGYTALSGDFNADGLTDLCLFKKSSGEFKVAFSNSKSFVDESTWITGYATDKDALVSDFNNDGLTDIGYWDKTTGRWYYAISTGDKFVDKGVWLDSFGSSNDESATTGDFNGNGITDAATFDKDQLGIDRWTTRLSTNQPADLLTEIDNGIGGKTKITYTYAASEDNLGLPFPVYVASSISLINTFPTERAATYTQNFSFSGGYFDTTEREFRGFAKVRVTDPITHNYSETYFYQGKSDETDPFKKDGALKGQIDKVIAYDGSNRKISETVNTYEVKKAGPEDRFLGFPSLKEQNTTVYEENGSSLATKNTFSYDNIGNLTGETSYGDITKTGDEKSTSNTYAQAYSYNTTASSGFNRPLESSLKDKDGNIVTQKNFEYDAKGNLAKDIVLISNPLTSSVVTTQTQYSYDDYGNLTSTTNALGKSVTTEYETDLYTYPAKVTNSLAHSISYIYDPKFGVVKSVTDTNGATSSTTYDSFARPVQVKNAYDQVVTTYTYPDFNTKTTTNAVGLFKTEYIDGLGRKYKAISSGEDGASQRNISSEVFYNERGLTASESLAHYVDEDAGNISYIRYRYDKRGRIAETISDFATPMQETGEPGDYSQLTGKDTFSSISYLTPLYVETTDPLGHRKGTLKDVYGNILEVREFIHADNETKPDGAFHTYYEYDTQNNLTKTTDNKGNTTQIFYDSIGRKLKMIDPDMGTWSYEYDILGNLKKQTDAKGQILTFEYDDLNRLAKKSSLRGSEAAEAISEYFYDDPAKDNCVGRLSKITDLSGSTEFFYDKLGREVKSIKSLRGTEGAGTISYTVQREYDVLDRLTKLTYPDGEAVNYTYDTNSGLLKSLRGTAGTEAISYVQNMSYNAKGQSTNILYGNNVQTTYTYGQDLRLANISTIHSPSSTILQNLDYTFDHNGNLTDLNDAIRNKKRNYTYDDLDRLISAKNTPAPGGLYGDFYYSYNSIGNMFEKTEPNNSTITMGYGKDAGPHALTSVGNCNYQYDANGNMTVGKNKILSYDTENRLLSVNEQGIITSFLYDGDGGRVRKTTGSNSTTYIGSLFEKDSSGKITKHIFAGSNRVASAIANPDGTKQTLYYHSDHLGSSNVITDQTGSLVQYCEYTPYGSLARNEGTDVATHKFTGKELDRTGLYFYGARYYDPEIGRFITADTIVQAPYNPQTLNRYTYCGNNPINYVDPTGHWFWALVWVIIEAVKAYAIAHPIIAGAIAGAIFNTAMNASNINSFGSFMTYAAIGAVAGAAGGGVGAYIGASSAFWGTAAGAFTGGFIAGAGNAGYGGASFGQAMLSGLMAGGIAAATAVVVYGAIKVGEKIISSTQKVATAQAKAVGEKTPVGQKDSGLTTEVGKGTSGDPIIDDPGVKKTMDRAWQESLDGQANVHEQGGWIEEHGGYRWPQGESGSISVPNTRPSGTIAEFHTHPYSSSERFFPGPSPSDFSGFNDPSSSVYGIRHFIVDRQGVIEYHADGNWNYIKSSSD